MDNRKISSFGDRFWMTPVIAMARCLPIESGKRIMMVLIPKVCQLIMRTEGVKPHID